MYASAHLCELGLARGPARPRLFAVAFALLAALAFAFSPAFAASSAAAEGLSGLQSDFTHQLGLGGAQDGAYVYDMTAHQVLFSERASTPRPPASVEKLYTTTTALGRMGAGARLSTIVYGSGTLEPDGKWDGNLYLRGGGDPTFGSSAFIAQHYGGLGASVFTLVGQLEHTDGIHRISGSVFGDESWFDSLRGEPSSDYGPTRFWKARSAALRSTAAKAAEKTARTRRRHTPHGSSCRRSEGPACRSAARPAQRPRRLARTSWPGSTRRRSRSCSA